MKKLFIGAVASLLVMVPAVAEEPVKEPSLVEQIATLTNKLQLAEAALTESKLETAKMEAKYIYVLNRYNEKAKKYKFAKIKR